MRRKVASEGERRRGRPSLPRSLLWLSWGESQGVAESWRVGRAPLLWRSLRSDQSRFQPVRCPAWPGAGVLLGTSNWLIPVPWNRLLSSLPDPPVGRPGPVSCRCPGHSSSPGAVPPPRCLCASASLWWDRIRYLAEQAQMLSMKAETAPAPGPLLRSTPGLQALNEMQSERQLIQESLL